MPGPALPPLSFTGGAAGPSQASGHGGTINVDMSSHFWLAAFAFVGFIWWIGRKK